MPVGFVKYREDHSPVWVYSRKSRADSAKVRDVRWGDFLNILDFPDDRWARIKWGKEIFFIPVDDVDNKRPLEVIFLDVGQGDGCVLISPEAGTDPSLPDHQRERIMLIDAGIGSNMYDFVKWRFGKLKKEFRFHAAVITHPDSDHYRGFQRIFSHKKVLFDRVYHNGLFERTGDDLLGPQTAAGTHLTDLAETHADAIRIYSDATVRGGKWYPSLINKALTRGRVDKVEMLSSMHGTREAGRSWMPGFEPSSGRSTAIEVLAPVPEKQANGRAMLRWFGGHIGSAARNEGKTKNGHSVILHLTMGAFKMLFGGDLNAPAEDYLLRHYSGIADNQPLDDAVSAASVRFGSDLMKSCHHGSNDVTDAFLKSVHPFAYVVSSGDEESHAHPRPDLLGRLGKLGRGESPLILCTELLRSTREKGREEDFKRLKTLNETIEDLATAPDQKAAAKKDRKKLLDFIKKRNVGVYGAITVRTDGTHLEISFQLEKPRSKQRWHRYGYRQSAHDHWEPAGETANH